MAGSMKGYLRLLVMPFREVRETSAHACCLCHAHGAWSAPLSACLPPSLHITQTRPAVCSISPAEVRMYAGYHRERRVSGFARIVSQFYWCHRNTAPVFSRSVVWVCGEEAKIFDLLPLPSSQHMAKMCVLLWKQIQVPRACNWGDMSCFNPLW